MKKLLLSTALLLLFCTVFAQDVNDEVLDLQKSNASLKRQLQDQRSILLNQALRYDSLALILQSAVSEISKLQASTGDLQSASSDQASVIKAQQSSILAINKRFSNRKSYALFAGIGSVFIVLIGLFYLNKKSAGIKNEIKEQEENLSKKISQTHQHADKEIAETKALVGKQVKEINLVIESQNAAISKVEKQTSEAYESANKIIENRIAGISNDLSAAVNEINEKLKNLKKS